MREIFFRGKRIDNGEWVYGSLSLEYFKECGCVMISPTSDTIFKVVPESVGEYSGLRDKNGKRIFEGDIVEFESHGYIPLTERGTVAFRKGCFGIDYKNKYGWGETFHRIGKTEKWQDMGASGTVTFTYEVIGDISNNPELLEGR